MPTKAVHKALFIVISKTGYLRSSIGVKIVFLIIVIEAGARRVDVLCAPYQQIGAFRSTKSIGYFFSSSSRLFALVKRFRAVCALSMRP